MPIYTHQCSTCLKRTEGIFELDAPCPPCEGCGGETARLINRPARVRVAPARSDVQRSNWDRYDSSTLQTHAGARAAAYEVAREGGLSKTKAAEAADVAADGMRRSGDDYLQDTGQ